MSRTNILNLAFEELQKAVLSAGEKKFRAEQIYTSLHKRGAQTFDDIRGIPLNLRTYLGSEFYIPELKLERTSDSSLTTTKKFLFRLSPHSQKLFVESVLITESGRQTLCVSTQAGCNVGCGFCATGMMGFRKNLDVSEILLQVYQAGRISGEEITNIVFMGMGEPFLNYDNLLKSLKALTSEYGMNLSSRKITVSTVGFCGKIRKFADDLSKPENADIRRVKLALSLHTTDNGLRETLIPTSVKNRLPDIYKELEYFYRKTKNKLTYEYIYFKGLNDTDADIKRLTKLSRMLPSNINIIPFHPVGFELSGPLSKYNDADMKNLLSNESLFDFIAKLRENKVVVNLRSSSGVDINAACGQLAVMA